MNLDVRVPYIYSFDLNTDPGWSREEAWQYGTPMGKGGGGTNGNPDPTAGHTGTSVFGVNLNGDYPTQVNGMHSLVAGPFDLRGYSQTKLDFWRWLNTPAYFNGVSHWIEVRNETSPDWTPLWSNSGNVYDSAWTEQILSLDSIGDDHLRRLRSLELPSDAGWRGPGFGLEFGRYQDHRTSAETHLPRWSGSRK